MDAPKHKSPRFALGRAFFALLVIALALGLGLAVRLLDATSTGLAEMAQMRLAESGVSNPVTAVLLNFRGYDTLLEMGVLLLAVLAAWSLTTPVALPSVAVPEPGPILIGLVRLLVPLMLLVAGYLLWSGTGGPGGAFQGGAILGAAWVLLLLSGSPLTARFWGWPLRAALVLGLAVFLAVSVGVMADGGRFLEYPRDWAGRLILLVEAALTLSIGFILAALFLGGSPTATPPSSPESER